MEKTATKVNPLGAAQERVARWKAEGQKVVFTNGCFDLLHLGHITYLEEARSLGDRLVIGVNTDASVGRLKGFDRPINDQRARALALAALQCVDLVVMFDEDTPLSLIAELKPDILVKGGDYLAENIVGAEIVSNWGGTVSVLSLVPGYSTTDIINRIKKIKK